MSSVPLEPAIPASLRQDRTLPTKLPPNYTPPFPTFTSRFPESITEIVMGVLGVQYRQGTANDGKAISKLISFIHNDTTTSINPVFAELASVTDNVGAYNIAILAYWPSAALYEEWSETSGFKSWWNGLDPAAESNGWFLEVFSPSMDRWENVLTSPEVLEGASNMRDAVSGQIQEHGYWGSMRDRIPASQTEGLVGEHYLDNEESGALHDSLARRIRVPGKKNLTVIRSGQDWSCTLPKERELYLAKMHPVLIKGMNFLRDEGSAVGCYSCRFMSILDNLTRKEDKDRTFGLAYFDDLANLEKWCRSHKTHLDIFGQFGKYAKELENEISLKLWHDVMVLSPEQQAFDVQLDMSQFQ
ncbi:hypothetical protein CC78DRAFT_567808 [Lojkania enalia]|uniref:Phenylacetaldoxime dehydratase n=1 Tax=Lojkania enalia TaxID=147567 RepID=A0A9P4KFQ2_9PLEO|nr:hypothetical protein CC78DRAFT_567808 [Didymosphaeria enalia]